MRWLDDVQKVSILLPRGWNFEKNIWCNMIIHTKGNFNSHLRFLVSTNNSSRGMHLVVCLVLAKLSIKWKRNKVVQTRIPTYPPFQKIFTWFLIFFVDSPHLIAPLPDSKQMKKFARFIDLRYERCMHTCFIYKHASKKEALLNHREACFWCYYQHLSFCTANSR